MKIYITILLVIPLQMKMVAQDRMINRKGKSGRYSWKRLFITIFLKLFLWNNYFQLKFKWYRIKVNLFKIDTYFIFNCYEVFWNIFYLIKFIKSHITLLFICHSWMVFTQLKKKKTFISMKGLLWFLFIYIYSVVFFNFTHLIINTCVCIWKTPSL